MIKNSVVTNHTPSFISGARGDTRMVKLANKQEEPLSEREELARKEEELMQEIQNQNE